MKQQRWRLFCRSPMIAHRPGLVNYSYFADIYSKARFLEPVTQRRVFSGTAASSLLQGCVAGFSGRRRAG
jgi:hypothetical protein